MRGNLVGDAGVKRLAGALRQIAEDYKYWRGGLPDLLLLDPAASTAKFVEVKGPNDTLMTRQRWWLARLAEFGADVEVFRIEAGPDVELAGDSDP